MRRLVWIYAGRKRTMLVLSWRGSYNIVSIQLSLQPCLFVKKHELIAQIRIRSSIYIKTKNERRMAFRNVHFLTLKQPAMRSGTYYREANIHSFAVNVLPWRSHARACPSELLNISTENEAKLSVIGKLPKQFQ
jgi:hypothetical protein